MLMGALGCNLTWGIVDAGIYLLARINDRGRKIATLRAMRGAPDIEAAQRILAEELSPLVASVLRAEQLELMRSISEPVADRLHVSYRLRVRRGGDPWNVVEQHLLCAHDGGRITTLDLVCSGFRPEYAGS